MKSLFRFIKDNCWKGQLEKQHATNIKTEAGHTTSSKKLGVQMIAKDR